MSFKVNRDAKELGWMAQKVRHFLMNFGPGDYTDISMNDLFNSGYGEFAAVACQVCFSVTFISYGNQT